MSACALFYNVNQDQEEDQPFWDGLIENFWVAFYTVVIVTVFMLIAGIFFAFPQKKREELSQITDVNRLKTKFKDISNSRKLVCCRAIGLIVLILLLIFFTVYIFAFSIYAKREGAMDDWFTSFSISFIIEEILLEILAVTSLSLLIILSMACSCGRCLKKLVVLIELYRIYRDLS